MNDLTLNEIPAVLVEILKSVKRIENKLEEHAAPTKPAEDILNVKDAAALLHITIPALYTKVSRREIPFCKPGRRLYFSRELINKWIINSKIKTYAELDEEASITLKNRKR